MNTDEKSQINQKIASGNILKDCESRIEPESASTKGC